MDFTIDKYRHLLQALQAYCFESLTLRHDVDLLPGNSLRTAQLEAEMGMFGVYYFRAVPESWDEGIIREIAATRVTERGGRADDKRSETAMEDRKKEGYF